MQLDVERFLALVCRELGAEEAHVREAGDPLPEGPGDPCELRWRMPDGRSVVARFALPPADHEVRQRRLEMLASTFDSVWDPGADKGADDARPPRSRPPVARSLRDELAGLCERAGAINAVVVDANSPVVWGAAHPEGLTEPDAPQPVASIGSIGPSAASAGLGASDIEPITSITSLDSLDASAPEAPDARDARDARDSRDGREPTELRVVPTPPVSSAAPVSSAFQGGANDVEPESDGTVSPTAQAAAASRIAVQVVRTMSDGAASRKGKHVRHVERNGEAPFVAHSFAGIYLLVVVFGAPFDELRAERTIVEALPRIERLVMALPPLDPSPPRKGAGVVSMRRRS